MKCPGVHCPGCKDVPVAAVLAVGGFAAAVLAGLEFLADILVVAGTMTGVALVLLVLQLVRLYRRGDLLRPLVVLHRRNAIGPVSEPPAVTARPVQALPAPEFHLHLHGPVTREQLDGLAAIREAGYRAYDSERR